MSQLLGSPVDDPQDERLGRIIDVLALSGQVGRSEPTFPSAFLVEGEGDLLLRLPLSVLELHEDEFRLCISRAQLSSLPSSPLPGEQEIRLARDVLDKQAIDLARKKTVRVNDVCFGDNLQILGIDNSTLGLVRRLAPAWLLGGKGRESTTAFIPWERIELIDTQPSADDLEETQEPAPASAEQSVRNPTGHLGELLYPADIAEIVQQLTPGQGARIIESLDDETAADTMEEVATERQRLILEKLSPERAASILRAMGPDEIADLLAQMPEERAQELLRFMNPQDSEDVQELLEYEADTAGGLMTTDYIVLNQTRSAREALEVVRREIQENDLRAAYVYCVHDESCDDCQVLGALSLWDLLVAPPEKPLQDLMEPDVISVLPDTPARAVAEKIAKYNLLAVPVVSADGILQGVVTIDDAIDVLLPDDRKRKRNRMF
ncbi:MAG TPA: CBS domain-containing protein [Ktedonobacteraceae bacterium]|nr:CBS domain-containing protein [Ktedonobacteraceae bacterium]